MQIENTDISSITFPKNISSEIKSRVYFPKETIKNSLNGLYKTKHTYLKVHIFQSQSQPIIFDLKDDIAHTISKQHYAISYLYSCCHDKNNRKSVKCGLKGGKHNLIGKTKTTYSE